MLKTVLVAFTSTCLFSQIAIAGSSPITITGILSNNPRGNASFITTQDGKEYTFDPVSKVGKKIWKTCEFDKECTVTGAVIKFGDMIDSVKSAKKTDTK